MHIQGKKYRVYSEMNGGIKKVWDALKETICPVKKDYDTHTDDKKDRTIEKKTDQKPLSQKGPEFSYKLKPFFSSSEEEQSKDSLYLKSSVLQDINYYGKNDQVLNDTCNKESNLHPDCEGRMDRDSFMGDSLFENNNEYQSSGFVKDYPYAKTLESEQVATVSPDYSTGGDPRNEMQKIQNFENFPERKESNEVERFDIAYTSENEDSRPQELIQLNPDHSFLKELSVEPDIKDGRLDGKIQSESKSISECNSIHQCAESEDTYPLIGNVVSEQVIVEPEPAEHSLLDNGPFIGLVEELTEIMNEFDGFAERLSTDEGKMLSQRIVERLQESLERSGIDPIENETNFTIKRHTPVPMTKVSEGSPIEEYLALGLALEKRVFRKAKVRIKNLTDKKN